MNIKKKTLLGLALLSMTANLNAENLDTGLHLMGAQSDYTLNVGDFADGIKTIYSINDSKLGYKSFLPTNSFDFLNTLKSLEAGKGYLIQVESPIDFANYKVISNVKECSVEISTGLNIVALPANTSLPIGMDTINGAQIKVIYSINDSKLGYKSYLPTNNFDFLNTLKSIEDGKYYLVLAESDSTGVCSSFDTAINNDIPEAYGLTYTSSVDDSALLFEKLENNGGSVVGGTTIVYIDSTPVMSVVYNSEYSGEAFGFVYNNNVYDGTFENSTLDLSSFSALSETSYVVSELLPESNTTIPDDSNNTVETPPEVPSLEDNTTTETISTPPQVPSV